jgi:dUTP pyrophosphatase
MKTIAKFEKVSFEQFKKDIKSTNLLYTEDEIKDIYDKIQLPKRATKGSAGYDFKMPAPITMEKGIAYTIPTGIRCFIQDGWVLQMHPRSGLGFKKGFKLLNTTGIIDSDYYNSNNEGHIMAKVSYGYGEPELTLEQGDGFLQGVFIEYGITVDDNTEEERNGGFGSTGR